jgi:uncharacterized protein (UPF0332 family)
VNNLVYDKSSEKKVNPNIPQSLLSNLSGYDLAMLNNKYINTVIGKNILYGLNLREALDKKSSKTHESMFTTVDNEPELFLYYNNGITILASSFNVEGKNIILNDFSIINGAQTTSTLGAYLKKAQQENDQERINKLKQVYVLTKVYRIDASLVNHEKIRDNIRIFNNTQTPLSSRDMVSIREEQITLQARLLDNKEAPIFMFIKKGEAIPNAIKLYPHQKITNELLAQLVLCGFCIKPFEAKDKKTKLFDNESKEGCLLNIHYHNIFHKEKGLLFQKDIKDINELLFVYRLHEDTKQSQKVYSKNQQKSINEAPLENGEDKASKEKSIDLLKRANEILNVCLFFNVATYYEIRKTGKQTPNHSELVFDYKRYYDKKDSYRDELMDAFYNLSCKRTISIVRDNSGIENVNNWFRSEKNQDTFLSKLRNSIALEGRSLSNEYKAFLTQFKIVSK